MKRFADIWRDTWSGVKNRGSSILAGVALFAVFFLGGLHLFFPTRTIQQWLAAELGNRTPVRLQTETLALKPFFTLGGRDIVATYDNRPVIIDELRLKPLWSSLFSSDPGVTVEATLLQGRLDAALRRGGAVALHTEGIKLTDLPIHPETRTLLSGTIVKGDLQGSFPARKGSDTRLALDIADTKLTVLGQPLALGKVTIEGNGQGNSLRLTTLSASGGDMTITGTGNLLLGPSAAASRVNIDLTLKPTSSAPSSLTALLDLATQRQADGSYHLKLSGATSQLDLDRPTRPQQSAPVAEEE